MLALSALFLSQLPAAWVRGAGAGAGSAVAAVAVQAAIRLLVPSWGRAGSRKARRARWVVYLALGIAAGALVGPYVVLVLLGCGVLELAIASGLAGRSGRVGGASCRCPWRPPPRAGSRRWPGSRSRSARCRTAAGS